MAEKGPNNAVSIWDNIHSAFRATDDGSGENELIFDGRNPQESNQALLTGVFSESCWASLQNRLRYPSHQVGVSSVCQVH